MKATFLNELDHYAAFWSQSQRLKWTNSGDEELHLSQFRTLISESGLVTDRKSFPAHFTGSSLILTHDFKKVLLTLHGKLNRWLQLGGHIDVGETAFQGAFREAKEESGLEDLQNYNFSYVPGRESTPWDIDVHPIPARKDEPEHRHYDVRYLFVTRFPDSIVQSSESNELKWFPIEEVPMLTNERSLIRQIQKLGVLT